MNHTQTAQAAMAAHAAGQVPEVQAEGQAQQTVQIGFERALIMFNPEWRTALTPEQVNQFRHFYHRGVQDIGFLIQMSNQTMQQNLDAVMNTVIVTGNEDQIAAAQKAAVDAAAAETTTKKPSKSHKAPTPKKTAPKGKTTAPKAPAKAVAKKGRK